MKKHTGIQKLINSRKNVKPSYGEKIVIEYLRKNKITFHREHTMAGLFNPDTNYPLFFDFYIPSLKMVIEVDGRQHSEAINGNTFQFNSLVYRDNIKNVFCDERDIKMLRLTYNQLRPPYSVLAEAIGGILIHRKITSQQKGFKKQKQLNKIKHKKHKYFQSQTTKLLESKMRRGKELAVRNKQIERTIDEKRAAARNNYPADIKNKLGLI